MEVKTLELLKESLELLKAKIKMTVSEWADKNRILSKESSAEPGQWKTSKTEYLREPMDMVTNPEVEEITIMASSQLGKTEVALNAFSYHADQDPCPILYVQPSEVVAKEFSKERIEPLLRDNPSLSHVNGPILRKNFPGGYLALVSANNPNQLASKPIRVVISDEVDRYINAIKSEGDPLELAEKRTTTFWNRKLIRVSTPTIKDISKIEKLYNLSSMAQWCIPCPSCGEYQPYEWERLDFDSLEMNCCYCGSMHSELEWKKNQGKWIHRIENIKHKGYHIFEMASPWSSWKGMVTHFLEIKNDPEKLRTFYNTSLGRVWELNKDKGIQDKWKLIRDRAFEYESEIPDEVLLLTAGVDVQDDRLELEVVGWSNGEKSYGIEYKVFTGDPEHNEVWKKLENFLKTKRYAYLDGSELGITFTCVDTGDHTTEVYEWIKYCRLPVKGIKGIGGFGRSAIHKKSKNNASNLEILILGVNDLKDKFFARIDFDEGMDGCCYFPVGNGYTDEYFMSLISEVKDKVFDKKTGRYKIEYRKLRKRNEGLDLRNYATAALEYLTKILKLDLKQLQQIEKKERVDIVNNIFNINRNKERRTLSKGVN